MQIEIFTLPVYDNREQTEEMNNTDCNNNGSVRFTKFIVSKL